MSEAEWCVCVTRRGFIPGDARRAGVVRLDTSVQATWVAVIGCPACAGTGTPVDTLDTLAKEWREACERNGTPLSTIPDFWIDNCITARDPSLALLYTPQRLGAKWNASVSLIARTEAFIARERAMAFDTLESLAKEMASVSLFSVSEMVNKLQWAIQQTGVSFGVSWGGQVGLRADAFVKRERAKLADTCPRRQPDVVDEWAGDTVETLIGEWRASGATVTREWIDGLISGGQPHGAVGWSSPKAFARWLAERHTPVPTSLVARTEAFIAREQAKASDTLESNAAPTLPTNRDFDALTAHVRALGRENEAVIPAARRVEALLAELRTALDEVSCARPVSPASTLAATIPAEPVGMASDGEDETCW
jgi:hypothetical protein